MDFFNNLFHSFWLVYHCQGFLIQKIIYFIDSKSLEKWMLYPVNYYHDCIVENSNKQVDEEHSECCD